MLVCGRVEAQKKFTVFFPNKPCPEIFRDLSFGNKSINKPCLVGDSAVPYLFVEKGCALVKVKSIP